MTVANNLPTDTNNRELSKNSKDLLHRSVLMTLGKH
jgi:hypothetical protein